MDRAWGWVALLLLAACLPLPLAAAPDTPAIMILTGRIAPGSGLDTSRPLAEDQVLAFSTLDGQLVGSGPVSAQGDYAAIVSATMSFNGTTVALELMQGRFRYRLLQDGAPVALRFRGRLLPERTVLDLQVGPKTAELTPDEMALPQAQRLSQYTDLPCDPMMDVNGDGQCDAQDRDILKLYGAGVGRSVAHPRP